MTKDEKGLKAFAKGIANDKAEEQREKLKESIAESLKKIKEIIVTEANTSFILKPSNELEDRFKIKITVDFFAKDAYIEWSDGAQVSDSATVKIPKIADKIRQILPKISGGNAARNKALGIKQSQTTAKKRKTSTNTSTQKTLKMSDRNQKKTANRKENNAAKRSSRQAAKPKPTEAQLKAAAAKATAAAERKADAARVRAAAAQVKKAKALQARTTKKIDTLTERIEKYTAARAALKNELAQMQKMAKIVII